MTGSLDDFLESAVAPPRCFLCGIPERDEIERVRAANPNASFSKIRDWLIARGYADVTDYKVSKHFQRLHHERPR